MTRFTRRHALHGLGGAAGVALAGCLAPPAAGPDGGDGTDDGSDDAGNGGDTGNGNEDGDDVGNGEDDADHGDGVEIEIHRVADGLSKAVWDHRERPGVCFLFRDAFDGEWLFADADADARAFVSGTDFDAAALLYVESVGPTICYTDLEFGAFTRENGTLAGEAAAIDTAADDEMCGPALNYPGALVRVTADPLPEVARLRITNGWGEEATVRSDDNVLDPGLLRGYVEPAEEPPAVPDALVCDDDGFERHYPGYADPDAVAWGSAAGVDGRVGLELRVLSRDEPPDPPDVEASEHDALDEPPLATAGDTETANGPDHPTPPEGALTFSRGDEVRIELTNVSSRQLGVGNEGKYNLEAETAAGWTEVRGGDDGESFPYTDELRLLSPGERVSWAFTMTEDGLVEGGPHADRLRVCPALQPGRYRFVFWGAEPVAVAFDYEG